MIDQTRLHEQRRQLERLLETAGDDKIVRTQLESSLELIREQLAASGEGVARGQLFPQQSPELPRAAIFLSGDCVRGSEAIDAGFASEVIKRYEGVFAEIAVENERSFERRRSGKSRRACGDRPRLMLTSLPKGSFGFEFEPVLQEGNGNPEVHERSLKEVADTLSRIGSADEAFDEALQSATPAILHRVKQFYEVLSKHDAELRLAFPNGSSTRLTKKSIRRTAERLAKSVTQATVTLVGEFRGATLESHRFDFKSEDDRVIRGVIPETLSEHELLSIAKLTGSRCKITLTETVITKPDAAVTRSYTFIRAAHATSQHLNN
ncbi:MAG: hypothetical protein AAFV43_11765 [Planctomycetota bacterium]